MSEAAISASKIRVRLHFPTDRSVHIGDLQLALMTTLWAWSRKGVLVATDDATAALDDLQWLEVEPNEVVSVKDRAPLKDMIEPMIEAGLVYACYCTPAELREMPATPLGFRESVFYDGRCRQLSLDDQKALSKAGRKPTFRLRIPDDPNKNLPKRLQRHLPKRLADFVVLNEDASPTTAFSAAVNDEETSATHCLLHNADEAHLHHRVLIANALGYKSPEFSFIPDVEQTGSASIGKGWPTISTLRESGFHPNAVRTSLLQSGWTKGTPTDLSRQASRFKLGSLPKQTAQIDLTALQSANSSVLHDMQDSDRVDAVFNHLARRGFSFDDKDRRWRTKFVSMVVDDMNTLADAESMAAHVLTSTVDYDKAAAELLRGPKTQALIDTFEKLIKKGKTSTQADWKRLLSTFRQDVDVPGRALAIIRLVLTGERSGPNLITLMVLLGESGTRSRLDKARKYRS